MKNIHKNFTGVKALQAVDFSLREGEIHALMGENGAGKSTLIKVLTGVYEKDEGEIFLKGNDKAVAIHSPQDAQNLGISTVYQEITRYSGKSNTAAGKLFHCNPADGSHCQGCRHGL